MPFNMAAPAECSTVLFEALRLPPPASATRLKNGGFSTKVSAPSGEGCAAGSLRVNSVLLLFSRGAVAVQSCTAQSYMLPASS